MNWLFSPILLISVLLSSLTVFDQLIRDHVPVLIRLSCYKIPLAYTTPHYRQPGHRRAVQSATLRVACSFPLSLVYSRDQLVSRLEPKTRDVSAAIHRSCKIACASSLLRARVWQMRSTVASESTWLQMSQRESQLIRSFTRLFVWIGLWRSGSSFFYSIFEGSRSSVQGLHAVWIWLMGLFLLCTLKYSFVFVCGADGEHDLGEEGSGACEPHSHDLSVTCSLSGTRRFRLRPGAQ